MGDLSFTSFSGVVRPTARGLYDADAQFRADADKIVYYVQRNMGSPVLDSELDLRQIWTAFEDATAHWSYTVNMYHARNVMLDLLGTSTGSLSGSENALPVFNTAEFSRRVLIQYSAEFGVGSPYPTFTASIDLVPDKQRYNLLTPISGQISGTTGMVQIRKVHHYEPTAAYRFFDTTSVLNFMANNMGFQSYSPETIFYLLPIWEDIARGNQLQLNQRVRRSNYSFDIQGYELIVYPVPNRAQKLYFEYTLSKDPLNLNIPGLPSGSYSSKGVISNLSNVNFGHLGYSDINSIGRQWIWKMTLAICKEILGNIRSTYSNLPVPDGSITLNGPELLNQARTEKENLQQELREILDSLSYKNLLSERTEIEAMAQESFSKVPLLIYISR